MSQSQAAEAVLSAPERFEKKLKEVIRDVPDFPKPGILFKDITPVLHLPEYRKTALEALLFSIHNNIVLNQYRIDAIAGMESRGFLFGMMLADHLNVPFIPIRKAGKLPYHKISKSYNLEYGEATIEMHTDAVTPDMHVLIHDDLLATGGTAQATAQLIKQAGGVVAGFAFLIELEFIPGREVLRPYVGSDDHIISVVKYS